MLVMERRSDNYAPPMRLIRYVLRKAAKKGLRTDWDYCGVLESGALTFACISEKEPRLSDLVAVKLSGKWKFFTDREYMALKLLAGDTGKDSQ